MATIIEYDDDQPTHLCGGGIADTETLCGDSMTGNAFVVREGTPTCSACIELAQQLLKHATPKEILAWKI